MTTRTIYMPKEARLRQLERLIRQRPGITLRELAELAVFGYTSSATYVRRLVKDGRIEVVLEEPATPGCTRRLYAKEGK